MLSGLPDVPHDVRVMQHAAAVCRVALGMRVLDNNACRTGRALRETRAWHTRRRSDPGTVECSDIPPGRLAAVREIRTATSPG